MPTIGTRQHAGAVRRCCRRDPSGGAVFQQVEPQSRPRSSRPCTNPPVDGGGTCPANHPSRAPRRPQAQMPSVAADHAGQFVILPARQRADAHQEHQRRHQRDEHRVEVRRADRDLAHAQRVEEQRIQACRAAPPPPRTDQQHVVDQQHRLARDEPKLPPDRHAWRAPGDRARARRRSR